MTNNKLLDVVAVDANYGPIKALSNVSMHVNEGEIVSLIGANGAGKSTLLMSIFADPKPESGHIYFAGQDTSARS